MFERYTDDARRALFFARYEASQLGSMTIETEHLLLGVLRQPTGVASRIFSNAHVSADDLRSELKDKRVKVGILQRLFGRLEVPFSPDTKRALAFAAEEADRLRHAQIGPQHLLLGLFRVDGSQAAAILARKGLRLDAVREGVGRGGEPDSEADV